MLSLDAQGPSLTLKSHIQCEVVQVVESWHSGRRDCKIRSYRASFSPTKQIQGQPGGIRVLWLFCLLGFGEMAQCLRVTAGHAQNQLSVPRINMMIHKHL